MPTLYIHAGMPKTGTTALQSFLKENMKSLPKKIGMLHPKTGLRANRVSHIDLFPVTNEIWNELAREISLHRGKDVVISYENIALNNFSFLEGKAFDLIQKVFHGYTIKIILYIRRIDDYIKSRFAQELRASGRETYAAYFELMRQKRNPCLYVSDLIKKAEGIIGKDNLIVRIYDRSKLHNNDIISDFFSIFNIKLPKNMKFASRTNPSLPSQSLPFLSKTWFPDSMPPHVGKQIRTLINQAYTFTNGSGVGDDYLAEFGDEINKIDNLVPGYKTLFDDRPCSFSFSEVDPEPQSLLICSLLYSLLGQGVALEKRLEDLQKNNMQNGNLTLREELDALHEELDALRGRLKTLEKAETALSAPKPDLE